MREEIKDFQDKGWIIPSQFHRVSRGFLVPKPGTNKRRLFIDYLIYLFIYSVFFCHFYASCSGKPSWRGSLIPLHPLMKDSKVQINVPPLLKACGISTRDFLCCTLTATQMD